jgi:hypothetical protein
MTSYLLIRIPITTAQWSWVVTMDVGPSSILAQAPPLAMAGSVQFVFKLLILLLILFNPSVHQLAPFNGLAQPLSSFHQLPTSAHACLPLSQ